MPLYLVVHSRDDYDLYNVSEGFEANFERWIERVQEDKGIRIETICLSDLSREEILAELAKIARPMPDSFREIGPND